MEALTSEEQRRMYDAVIELKTEFKGLNEAGCREGRRAQGDLYKRIDKEIGAMYRKLTIIASMSAGIGALITYLWKF